MNNAVACDRCRTSVGECLIPGYPAPRIITACQCAAEAVMEAEFKTWRAQITNLEHVDGRAVGRQELLALTREMVRLQREILAAIRDRQ